MKRADHFRAADHLVGKARRYIDAEEKRVSAGPDPEAYARYVADRGSVPGAVPPEWPTMKTELPTLWLAVAQVHATLAAAGPGVEQEVLDDEKRVAQALGAAESSQRARQAARPPLRREGGPVDAGRPVVIEETAGTVRPKPSDCRCLGPEKLHVRGVGICMHNPQTRTGR